MPKLTALERLAKKEALEEKRKLQAINKANRDEEKAKQKIEDDRIQALADELQAKLALQEEINPSKLDPSKPSFFFMLCPDTLSIVFHFLPAKALGAALISCKFLNDHVNGDYTREVFRGTHVLARLTQCWPEANMLDAHHIIANNGSNSHSTNSKPKPPKKKKGAKPSQNMFPFSCFMAFLEESIYSEKNAASNCNNSISLSPEHTLLKAGGNGKWGGGSGVKSYGVGKRGQLGHGTRDDVAVPKPIQSLGFKTRIVQISAGGGLVRVAHSLLLTDTGRVLSCGCAQYGALGQGYGPGRTLPDEQRPKYIEALGSVKVVCVSAGELHSAVCTNEGDVYTFGEGFCGQLGHGDKRPQLLPKIVGGDLEYESVTVVSCGSRHTMCVTEDHELFTFGLGHYGVLGRAYTPFENGGVDDLFPGTETDVGEIADIDAPPPPPPQTTTAPIDGLDETQHIQLDLLANLTLDDCSNQCLPKKVDALEGVMIRSASAGHRHALCIDMHNNVYSWGSGLGGALGHGDKVKREIPVLIEEFRVMNSGKAVQIAKCSAGVDTSMAVTVDGDCYSWGKSKNGRIGQGNGENDICLPRRVLFPDAEGEKTGKGKVFVVDAQICYVHSMIVSASGDVYGCGKVGINGESDGSNLNEGGGGPAKTKS